MPLLLQLAQYLLSAYCQSSQQREAQRIDREIDDEDTPAAVRQKLLQDSHVAWQRARAAAEAESRKTTRTLADMQRDAEELAASAPPAVAVALAAGLRRRGLVS